MLIYLLTIVTIVKPVEFPIKVSDPNVNFLNLITEMKANN